MCTCVVWRATTGHFSSSNGCQSYSGMMVGGACLVSYFLIVMCTRIVWRATTGHFSSSNGCQSYSGMMVRQHSRKKVKEGRRLRKKWKWMERMKERKGREKSRMKGRYSRKKGTRKKKEKRGKGKGWKSTVDGKRRKKVKYKGKKKCLKKDKGMWKIRKQSNERKKLKEMK